MQAMSERRGTRALIISGDFNAPPHHPGYEFLHAGKLTEKVKNLVKENTPLDKFDPVREKVGCILFFEQFTNTLTNQYSIQYFLTDIFCVYKEFQLAQKIFYLYILQVLIEITITHVQLIFLLRKLSSMAIQNACHFCDLTQHSDEECK